MSNALKVGLLGLASLGILAFFILRIDANRWNREPVSNFAVWLPDAQGLDDKAPVLLKGVTVGRVTGLDISGDGVRLSIMVAERFPLREGTEATVTSVGLLGEKQLELSPGPPEAPSLAPGAQIHGKASPSLDAVIGTMGEIGEDVKAVTGTVREQVTSEQTEAKFQEILSNVARLTGEMERVMRLNQAEIHRTVQGIRKVSEAAGALAESVARITGGQSGADDQVLETARQLRETSDNLAQVSQRLVDGEGSLGHWLASDETAKDLDAAIGSVKASGDRLNDALGGFSNGYAGVSLRGDYLVGPSAIKSWVELEGSLDGKSFARLGLVRAPESTEAPNPPLSVTLQGGYRARPFAVRLGLTESHPGLGADLLLFDDRVRISADAWDFGRDGARPDGRVEAEVRPLENLFLVGGVDDPLGRERASVFVGAGLRLFSGGDAKQEASKRREDDAVPAPAPVP